MVVDGNAPVSALLSPGGKPAEGLRLLLTSVLTINDFPMEEESTAQQRQKVQ